MAERFAEAYKSVQWSAVYCSPMKPHHCNRSSTL